MNKKSIANVRTYCGDGHYIAFEYNFQGNITGHLPDRERCDLHLASTKSGLPETGSIESIFPGEARRGHQTRVMFVNITVVI